MKPWSVVLRFLFVVMFSSSLVFAQATTGRVLNTGNGTTVAGQVYNTTESVWQVANRGTFYTTGSCVAPPILSKPYVYHNFGGDSLFNTRASWWTYPQNVTISGVTVRFCWHIFGTIYENLFIRPVYKNKLTGVTYEGPNMVQVNGVPGGFTYNGIGSTTWAIESSVGSTWTFASTGAPNISSLDVENGNIEFGFRITNAAWTGSPPWTGPIMVFGMDTRLLFTNTALVTLPQPITATYTPAFPSAWNQGSVTLTGTMPTPSSRTGLRIWVRCADGIYRRPTVSPPNPDVPWGDAKGTWTRTWRIFELNSACPVGAKLIQSGTTDFQVRPLDGNTVFGSTVWSNSLILN